MMEERDMLHKDKMKRSGLNIKEHNFMLAWRVCTIET